MLFGLACCAIELMQTGGPRADIDRVGAVPRAIPVESASAVVETSAPVISADDDPETAEVAEEFPRAIPRAIYVGPPRPHKPDIRPVPDVIVELNPPGS